MTDKEKLESIKAEFERRINKLSKSFYTPDTPCGIALQTHKEMLSYINSVSKEPVSEDFETALENKVREAQDWTYIEEEGGECPLNEEFGAYDLEEFARWGADWQKQQIMKEAVEGEITYGKSLAIPSLAYRLDRDGLDFGDKVKVLIIKED